MGRKIAYIVSRFPHLPETFILREMNELQRLGWDISLYPLIRQRQVVIHAESQPWIQRMRALPFLSRDILWEGWRVMSGQPAKVLKLGWLAVRENLPSPKFLLRAIVLFPKAIYAARLMSAEKVDHIHAHYATHTALVAWVIHQLTGISYSLTVHAHDIFVDTTMLATKLRSAAFVVAISEYNRQHLASVVGDWVLEKTHVVHCGVQPERFRTQAGERAFAPGEPLQIVHVGSLQPYKGQIHLIRACALLREQGVPFVCRLIGGGEERSKLERAIHLAGLKNQIHLLGPLPQEEVASLLPSADVYVQPSVVTPAGKMEGIPVALMEAMACGIPVVATALSGVPELVQPGVTGYLVPPGDAQSLANALREIYQDMDTAQQIARRGREKVLREFDLRQNVAQLSVLFSQTIATNSNGKGNNLAPKK